MAIFRLKLLFSGKKSISNYVKERRHLNLSDFPPNDIYVSIFSNTRIDSDHFFGKLKDGEKFRQVNYAIENEKLKQYVDQLHAMFKKYGIKVYGD